MNKWMEGPSLKLSISSSLPLSISCFWPYISNNKEINIFKVNNGRTRGWRQSHQLKFILPCEIFGVEPIFRFKPLSWKCPSHKEHCNTYCKEHYSKYCNDLPHLLKMDLWTHTRETSYTEKWEYSYQGLLDPGTELKLIPRDIKHHDSSHHYSWDLQIPDKKWRSR